MTDAAHHRQGPRHGPAPSHPAPPASAGEVTRAGPLLDAHLVVEQGGFRLDLPLRIATGEVVALVGPNGAGKTTAVRALAGLRPLTGGHVTLAGRDLDRPAASVWTPTERRPIGVVFQDHRLFPHLSALDNVAFGLRRRGVRRREARRRAADWLRRVGLAEHAGRKPRHLSGGQAQRVALARALAVGPDLLLLDEPFAALDARARLDIRAQLHEHLAAHPGATLLVTHDPLDALTLDDRLVVVEEGRLVQAGDAATVAARPRTDYVARLVGLNLCRGRAAGRTVALPGGVTLTVADHLSGEVFVAFPPSAVVLRREAPDGDRPDFWPATVADVQPHGDRLRVTLAEALPVAADLTAAVAAALRPALGLDVWASVAPTEVRAYPVG